MGSKPCFVSFSTNFSAQENGGFNYFGQLVSVKKKIRKILSKISILFI